MALTKVSGGILDPGINVAGIVTATGFDGPFTGGTGSNITAGIITATELDLNGDGDISGNLVVGGNLTANGDFTTLNTTLREVEILRVDADTTAIAGIITQRGTGDIFSAYDTSNEVFKIADGGDVGIARSIFHLGDTNTLIGFPENDKVAFRTAGVERLGIDSSGHATFSGKVNINNIDALNLDHTSGVYQTFRHDGTAKGYTGTGNHLYTGGSSDDFGLAGGTSADIVFATANAERLRIHNNGSVVVGHTTSLLTHATHNFQLQVIGTNFPTSGISQQRFENGNSGASLTLAHSRGAKGVYTALINGDEYGKIRFYGSDGTDFQGYGAAIIAKVDGNVGVNSTPGRLELATTEGGSNGSTTRIRIGSDGKVRLGGSANQAAAYTLDLGESASTIRLVSENNGTAIRMGAGDSGNDFTLIRVDGKSDNHDGESDSAANGFSIKYMGSRNGLENSLSIFGDQESGSQIEGITILNDCKVGIGTNIPGKLLEIFGTDPTIKLRDSSGDAYVLIEGDSADQGSIRFRADPLSAGANTHIRFDVDGTEALRINDDGKVGVGTDLTSSTYKFEVWDDTSATFMVRKGFTSRIVLSNDSQHNTLYSQALPGYTARPFSVYIGSSEALRIDSAGVTVTGEVAASQDYPNFQPALNFNFAAEKKLEPRVTYERTGPASFTNEFGKVVLVGDNAPRFDHDPDTKESLGLLIEPKKTNQWLYSEDLVTYLTGGNLQQATLENTTATTDPTGGTNAVKMIATQAGGAHSIWKNFTSGSNGDAHTFSVWVKAAGADYARIYVDTVGGNINGPGVTFSTGNVWNVSATGNATQVTTSAVKYPNGWWRLSTTGYYSNRNDYYFHIDIEGGEGDIGYTGNGSNGIYVWGAQVESSTQTNVTSYIPTYGTAVTRGDDIVKLDGEDFTDFYNQEEGTLVSEFKIFDRIQSSAAIANINALSSSSYANSIMFMEVGHVNGYFGRVYKNSSGINLDGSSDQSSIVQNGNQTNKVSFGWSAPSINQGLAAYLNGTLQEESTDESKTPTNMTELRIGTGWQQNSSENQTWAIHAHVKKLMYYPKRLSNNQLATLTS